MPNARRFVLAAVVAFAAPALAEDKPLVVVELFTSQGCNSCPPADAFFAELVRRTGLLPLAFHVDYWNYIGWNDPFARPWATARQRGYQQSLNERFIYTPQIVVNGAAQAVGSERERIEALLRKAQAATAPHPPLALRWREDGALLVDIGDGEPPAHAPADLWLIGFDRPHQTKVLSGENEGRTLVDDQVVHSYRRIGAWPGWSLELAIPASETASLGTGGVAVILQSAGFGPIMAAARIDPR